jgi:simple sugar transport system permease protein
MSRAVNVPTYIADVIVAVSLLSMLVATFAAQYRVVFRVAPGGAPHAR